MYCFWWLTFTVLCFLVCFVILELKRLRDLYFDYCIKGSCIKNYFCSVRNKFLSRVQIQMKVIKLWILRKDSPPPTSKCLDWDNDIFTISFCMSAVFLFHPYKEKVTFGFQLHAECFPLDSPPSLPSLRHYLFCPLNPIKPSKNCNLCNLCVNCVICAGLISANLANSCLLPGVLGTLAWPLANWINCSNQWLV